MRRKLWERSSLKFLLLIKSHYSVYSPGYKLLQLRRGCLEIDSSWSFPSLLLQLSQSSQQGLDLWNIHLVRGTNASLPKRERAKHFWFLNQALLWLVQYTVWIGLGGLEYADNRIENRKPRSNDPHFSETQHMVWRYYCLISRDAQLDVPYLLMGKEDSLTECVLRHLSTHSFHHHCTIRDREHVMIERTHCVSRHLTNIPLGRCHNKIKGTTRQLRYTKLFNTGQ